MSERLGVAHFLATFVFYYATFFPMHLAGLQGQIRRVYDPYQYEYLKPLAAMNGFITWAAIALALAQLLFFWNFFKSLRGGAVAGANHKSADTPEWSDAQLDPHQAREELR
jgi:cytochrome c oxidase subunit 1